MDVTEHELLTQEPRQREAYFAEALAGLHVDNAAQQQPQFEAQLQSTLNVIPANTWYAAPSGALTFVNKRTADYLSLPGDHPLRFGFDIGGEWDSHIPLLHPDDQEESRRVWATCLRTGSAGEFRQRVRNAEGAYRWFLCRADPPPCSCPSGQAWPRSPSYSCPLPDANRSRAASSFSKSTSLQRSESSLLTRSSQPIRTLASHAHITCKPISWGLRFPRYQGAKQIPRFILTVLCCLGRSAGRSIDPTSLLLG
jgi:hypothetical protein